MKQSLTLFGLSALVMMNVACGASQGFSTVGVSPEGQISSLSSVSPAIPAPAPAPAPTLQVPVETQPAPQVLTYNFVAGSQYDCEKSIRDRLGIQVACTIGGGCSMYAGAPTAQNPSANPTHWGACFQH